MILSSMSVYFSSIITNIGDNMRDGELNFILINEIDYFGRKGFVDPDK